MNESEFSQEDCIFFQIISQEYFLVWSNQLNDLIFIRNFKLQLNFFSEVW